MSIRQMKALEAIGRHGAFAAAARALNLTQSAISMQVATLEESLGVTLFDRSHRPMRLTRDGETVMRRAKAIVAEYDQMLDALEHTRSPGSVLRLGAIPTVLTNLLPQGLIALRETQPTLIVNVVSNLSGDLMRQVERAELDAALMHKPREIAEDLEWQEVAPQRVVVIAPPGSTQTTPKDVFAAHPYIRFSRSAWVAPMIEERLAELRIEPDTRAEIMSVEAIHLMVGLGFGASILPDVGMDAGDSKLRVVPFGSPPLFRAIGLLSRKDVTARLRMAAVRAVFADLSPLTDNPDSGPATGVCTT